MPLRKPIIYFNPSPPSPIFCDLCSIGIQGGRWSWKYVCVLEYIKLLSALYTQQSAPLIQTYQLYILVRNLYLSIYLSINSSISFYLSTHLSIYLSIYPMIHLYIYTSIYPSIYLYIYPSISIYISICLCTCISGPHILVS